MIVQKKSSFFSRIPIRFLDGRRCQIDINGKYGQQYDSNKVISPKKGEKSLAQLSLMGKNEMSMSNFQAQRIDKKLKENELLKEKVKALDELTSNMRKNYYKDLLVYKNPKKDWKNDGNKRNNYLNDEDQVAVEFFNALEGVDPEMLDIINTRLFSMKEKCERRLVDHIRFQEELLKKIYAMSKLSPSAFGIVNLSLQEIIGALKIMYDDPQDIWTEIHEHYGQDCFLTIIEQEYGGKFSKDYSQLNAEVDKVKEEAQFQIQEVLKSCQNEIQQLRKSLDNKNQEIIELKENQLKEIEKAKKEAYQLAELSFQTKEAKLFQRNDQEKAELYEKIKYLETVNTNFDAILTRLESRIIEQSINRILDIILGKTSQEIQSLKEEYEKDIRNLIDENNQKNLEMAEKRLQYEQQIEKIQYLEQCLSDSQQEAQMYKNQQESMREEQRKLEGEHNTLKRALENSQKLAEGVERERKRLENELNRLSGNNNTNKYQSAYAEAELHRKKAINSISNAGTTTLNNVYAHNNKTKGIQTNLKDVNAEIIFVKQKEKEIQAKQESQYKVPCLNYGCQTDPVIIMSEFEFRQIKTPNRKVDTRNSTSSHKFQFKSDADNISEKSGRSQNRRLNSRNKGQQNLIDVSEKGTQCELIVQTAFGVTPARQVDGKSAFMFNYVQGQSVDSDTVLADKFESNFKMRDLLKKMPQVYERLWLNVFEKAAKSSKIRQEFERIRQEQWDKVQEQLQGMKYPKSKNIFHKDSITGKVFINLVELYKNTQFLVDSSTNQTNAQQQTAYESFKRNKVFNSRMSITKEESSSRGQSRQSPSKMMENHIQETAESAKNQFMGK
ncbi:UNKNOWN [Stylonychia lemnae]|uniref:Uncharacterized protein n=1 Tax=Stylonychia lemnae TaxID=5949 RepID=A0A078AKU4_STYLE|nr:UNKNOWN [Stylonychia lemnae]|eukprot:CDW81423.1 UNKNOWN [Stylonychia lemnae]